MKPSASAVSRPVTIIRPKKGWQTLDVREVWQYRDLLIQLTLREIQVRYKQTILGIFWAIIQPLATSGVLAIFFGILMGQGNEPGIRGIPYFIATFCAMLPWQLFATSLSQAGGSLITNQRLITKVYFPRLIIPLSAVLSALIDFCVGLLALLVAMAWYGVYPSWPVIFMPLFVLLAVLVALAIGLWLAALSAIYRDFRYVIPFLIQLGFFISPVIFSVQSLSDKLPPWAIFLFGLNPMAGVIAGFRWCLLSGAPAPGLVVVPSIIMTIVLLLGGAYYFRYMEKWFADLI